MEIVFTTTETDIISGLERVDIEKQVHKLYELYLEDIVSYIAYRGGTRDDGADVFQEAVLVLIEKIKSGNFRKESSLKTFFAGIAKNLWLSEQRTRERRKLREENYSSGFELVEDPQAWKIKQKGISVLFDQVGDVCKNILIGFYYEEKSMKDLLSEFDFKNEQVLRNRKALCMKKLKELLAGNKELMQILLTDMNYE